MQLPTPQEVVSWSVEQHWEIYKQQCVPDSAGPEQLRQTRQAFYSGFMSMIVVCEMIAEPEISDEEGVAVLERLNKESVAAAKEFLAYHASRTDYERN
jgi:hypothetical protein